MNNPYFYASVLALTALLSGAADAATTQYDRDAFKLAFAGPKLLTENYDGAVGALPATPGLTYATNGAPLIVTDLYRSSTGLNGLGASQAPDQNGNPIQYLLANQTITFIFSFPIMAFAIDINTFDKDAGALSALIQDTGEVVSSIYDSFEWYEQSPGVFKPTEFGQFIGFSSDKSFSSITFSSARRDFTLDSLAYVVAPPEPEPDPGPGPAPVPVPAGLPLLLGGLGALGLLRRRCV